MHVSAGPQLFFCLAVLLEGVNVTSSCAGLVCWILHDTLQALRRVHGDSVPEPVAQYVTRWRSDEYSRGSYSFVSVGCSGAEYDSLAAPVAGRLLFAGEHTCKEHPDTVGGGWSLRVWMAAEQSNTAGCWLPLPPQLEEILYAAAWLAL